MYAVFAGHPGRQSISRSRAPRVRALALCLSAALAAPVGIRHAVAAPNPPWIVQNCTDHDTDSLRDIVQNKAQSGDIVDLSQLPQACAATDSTITLTTGEITVAQDDLTIQGPAGAGSVTISGGDEYRIFAHHGNGTLSIESLTLANGYSQTAGGCVYSENSVALKNAVITGCVALLQGGGISAEEVMLKASTLSGNVATPEMNSRGGGVWADSLIAKYSSITGNVATRGGGGRISGYTFIFASTIDHNNATTSSGGLYTDGDAKIYNSTISYNMSISEGRAALKSRGNAVIANSTIAFNHSDFGSAAVSFETPNTELKLQSSIIAKNTVGTDNVPSDLYVAAGNVTLSGSDNLVIASNASQSGAITVTSDPMLGPLQFNGGLTRTHMLSTVSPALGKGNNSLPPALNTNDQRGRGYPRVTGADVDIGAVQFDTIFANGFEFP